MNKNFESFSTGRGDSKNFNQNKRCRGKTSNLVCFDLKFLLSPLPVEKDLKFLFILVVQSGLSVF